MVQTLVAAGELRRELTYDSLRAAEGKGSKGGRRPTLSADKTGDVRTAYLEGRSIAALAREHGVSRSASVPPSPNLLPNHIVIAEDAPAPELPVTPDMPGKVADFLRTFELQPAERAALDRGVIVRRGQGYTLASPPSRPCTTGSSTAASRSTAATAFPQSRPSARPAESTRTASTSCRDRVDGHLAPGLSACA